MSKKADAQTPKIETGIPVPPRQNKHSYSAVMKEMKVGDSVLITNSTDRNQISSAASRVFGTGCSVTKKVEGGIRVWRTK